MSWVKTQATAPRDREFAQGFGIEVPASASDELDLGDGESKSEEEEETGPKFQVTGGEMKDDLSTLIKQNPEIAVNLLKAMDRRRSLVTDNSERYELCFHASHHPQMQALNALPIRSNWPIER